MTNKMFKTLKKTISSFIALLIGLFCFPQLGYAQQQLVELRAPITGKHLTHSIRHSPDSVLTWIVSLRPSPSIPFHVQKTRVESAITSIFLEEAATRKIAYSTHVRTLSLIGALSYQATRREALRLLELAEVARIEPTRKVSIAGWPELPLSDRSHNGLKPNDLKSVSLKPVTLQSGAINETNPPIIAVIDTGVDYRHPDLGGCLGTTCRVLGGYDFVDEDRDPMDENGHGTHVAGIAAGSGRSGGYEPRARLLAYRVLDKSGIGQSDDVIAAIELAIADGARIINLSLGAAGGSENDPLSRAVNEAVKRGVVVVVAAGNGGPFLYTIQTPANAALSLSVGAVDADGKPANFSARGPLSGSYRIKPDLVAPGVDILSAYPGARYLRLSGTSMATPAVAGLAARLWIERPGLTALQVRSLLIQSATVLPYARWEVGAGRINLSKAYQRTWGMYPELITLPVVTGPSSLPKRVYQDTLTVFNPSPTSRELRFEAQILPSISLKPIPGITLPAQSSLRVPLHLEIDDANIPYAQKLPPLYTGSLRVISSSPSLPNDTLHLPISLAKASQLHLGFDFPPDLVVVHDREKDWVFRSNTGNELFIELGKGQYDVIALRVDDGTKWIKEEILVEGNTPVSLNRSEAAYSLEFELKSPENTPVGACDFHRELLEYQKTGLQISFQYDAPCSLNTTKKPRSMISSFSEAYRYEVNHMAYGQQTNYEYWVYPFELTGGLRENRLLRSDPSRLRKIRWQYASPPGKEALSFIQYFDYGYRDTYRPPSWQRARFPAPAYRDEWISGFPSPEYRLRHGRYQRWYSLEGSSFDPESDPELLISPSYRLLHPDTLALAVPQLASTSSLTEPLSSRILTLGMGPDLFYRGAMSYTQGWLTIPEKNAWFTGWYRELRPSTVYVEVLDEEGRPQFSTLSQNTLPQWRQPEIPEGKNIFIPNPEFHLRLTRSELYLGQRSQQTEVLLSLDPTHFEKLNGCLLRMGIFDDTQQLIRETAPGKSLQFALESKDCPFEPEWAIADYPDGRWQALSIHTTSQGSRTRTSAQLERGLPDGYWNLRLQLRDPSTRRIVYTQTITPALRIQGNQAIAEPPPPPRLKLPALDAIITQPNPLFTWEALEKVTKYEFALSTHPQFDSVQVRRQVNLPEVQGPLSGFGRVWYWRVRAQNQEGWGPWSLRRTLTAMVTTSVNETPEQPAGYYLHQNYPNPFNPDTQIRFGIAKTEPVTLEVYTITGQLIKRLDLGTLQAGDHQLRLEMVGAANGLYLLRLRSPSYTATQKMTLLK